MGSIKSPVSQTEPSVSNPIHSKSTLALHFKDILVRVEFVHWFSSICLIVCSLDGILLDPIRLKRQFSLDWGHCNFFTGLFVQFCGSCFTLSQQVLCSIQVLGIVSFHFVNPAQGCNCISCGLHHIVADRKWDLLYLIILLPIDFVPLSCIPKYQPNKISINCVLAMFGR